MAYYDRNPYSSLDDLDEQYDDDDDSFYSSDAEAEWEESKQQLNALFSLVIFPFVGKWLGKKFSFWVWSRYMTSKPIVSRFLLDNQMVNSVKSITY